MSQTAHIAMSLLHGDVLSIMNAFNAFGCTNLPREISRSIEQKFGVTVSRVERKHVTRYGHVGYYYEYRLNKSKHNLQGIKKMEKYIAEYQAKKIRKQKEKSKSA